MRTRLLARTAAVTLALAATTACGAATEPTTTATAPGGVAMLSKSATKAARVPLEDLGPGFAVDTHKHPTSPTGCLLSLSRFDERNFPRAHQSDIQYAAESGGGVPSILSAVATFGTLDEAAAVMSRFRAVATGCHTIDTTTSAGLHLVLQLSTDEKVRAPGATAQVNVTAVGTGTADGLTLPYAVQIRLVQVDNNLSIVGLATVVDTSTTGSEELARIAAERLVALSAGDDPPPHDPVNLHVVTRSDISGAGTKIQA